MFKKKKKKYQKAQNAKKIWDEFIAGFSLAKINSAGKFLLLNTQSAQLPPVQTAFFFFFLACTSSINLKQEIWTNPLAFKETKRATKANHREKKIRIRDNLPLYYVANKSIFVVVHPSGLIRNGLFCSLTKTVFSFSEVIPNSKSSENNFT